MKARVGTRPPARRAIRARLSSGVWRQLLSALVYLRAMAVVVLVWQVFYLRVDNTALLPSPREVADNFVRLAADGELLDHTLISLRRLAIGFGLASVLAIPLGILMGFSRLAEELIDPVIELLRPISGIAWIPLALFIFGIGDRLPIFIMFYGSFFPFVLNTVAGVRTVDPVLVRAAQSMGMTRWVIVRHVVLPSALPSILVGARLGAGAAWMALVAAELIGAPSGLGFSVEWYRQLLMTPKVLAFIVMIGLLGYLTDRGLRHLQRWLTPWSIGIGGAP